MLLSMTKSPLYALNVGVDHVAFQSETHQSSLILVFSTKSTPLLPDPSSILPAILAYHYLLTCPAGVHVAC